MMCNSCPLAGTAACRICAEQPSDSKINIISESLVQDSWLKLLKDGVELQSGESITLKPREFKAEESKLNTYDLYYGTEFFKRITAENYAYDKTTDRFIFYRNGEGYAFLESHNLNFFKIN